MHGFLNTTSGGTHSNHSTLKIKSTNKKKKTGQMHRQIEEAGMTREKEKYSTRNTKHNKYKMKVTNPTLNQ